MRSRLANFQWSLLQRKYRGPGVEDLAAPILNVPNAPIAPNPAPLPPTARAESGPPVAVGRRGTFALAGSRPGRRS